MNKENFINIEMRILYAVAFTLLGVVLAVYVLPPKSLPEFKPVMEVLK